MKGNRAGRLPRNPRHASSIFAEPTGIDRIGLAALPERLCEASCPTRIDDADLQLAPRLQGQRQIQTVIPTGFQADSFVLFTASFAMVFLAFLYWVLEIKNWRGGWTMPILVFGMNAIVGFVADSLVYGPGYSFTAKAANGAVVSWHEAAQARLESVVPDAANASLVYSVVAVLFCCCCGYSGANAFSLRSREADINSLYVSVSQAESEKSPRHSSTRLLV